MLHKQNTIFFRFAAQLLLSGSSLALAAFVAFRLEFSIAATGFLYLIIIVLSALIGSFVASIVISVAEPTAGRHRQRRQGAHQIVVTVEDRGVGISAEN